MRRIKFGKAPAGKRLERIRQTPNYQHGAFKNLTKQFTPGHGLLDVLYRTSFNASARRFPSQSLPTIYADLQALPPDQDYSAPYGAPQLLALTHFV